MPQGIAKIATYRRYVKPGEGERYIEDDLMAAIDHLFSERPEIRKIDVLAGQGLSLEEAKSEMGYTVPDSSMESWSVNL